MRDTKSLITQATQKLSADNKELSNRRTNALSMFRKTAIELENINKGIDEKVSVMDELISYLNTEKTNLHKQSEDNANVRRRIMEIIGE